MKRVDRRTGASCADDETAVDLVQGLWQVSFDDVPGPYPVRVVAK